MDWHGYPHQDFHIIPQIEIKLNSVHWQFDILKHHQTSTMTVQLLELGEFFVLSMGAHAPLTRNRKHSHITECLPD